jgi:hypothetical protein
MQKLIIQGVECEIPDPPPHHLIQGFALDKADQKWSRTPLPSIPKNDILILSGEEYPPDYNLTWEEARREEYMRQTGKDLLDPTREERRKIIFKEFDRFYLHTTMEDFRKQEIARLQNGHWFYNNGEPTYLTPVHYFYLNYWMLNTGYPEYRETDRDLFYFWEAVCKNDACYGVLEITKRGQGKCLGINELVRMYDGSLKAASEIQNGDYVMGDDSGPRLVYDVHHGESEMFEIVPKKGKSHTVNKYHTIHCVINQGEHFNISVEDYLNLPESTKNELMIRRVDYLSKKTSLCAFTVKPIGVGKYAGFSTDGNRLFLLADGTVTHNSYRMGAVSYLTAISYFNAHVGIQSKTDDDAEAFYLDKIREPYKSLPDFLIPVNSHGLEPTNGMYFYPSRSSRKTTALRSRIDFRSSTELAYDGSTLKFLVQDEVAKCDPAFVDVQKRLGINRNCVYRDSKMIGKMWLSTTVEDMGKGGGIVQKIWEDSDLSKLSRNGSTKSGLWRFFTSALDCSYFDEYGRPDRIKAKQVHDAEREIRNGDSIEYVGYIQRNPYTISEAFYTSSSTCLYNAYILQERQKMCHEVKFTERGDFVWENGVKDSRVVWMSNPENGRWEISWMFPNESDACDIIRTKDTLGNDMFEPKNENKFSLAYDPFSHANTASDKNRSNAGAAVYREYDFWDDEYSDTFVCDYVARPQDPEEAHEDIIKTCVYFSCMALIENNKNGAFDYIKRRGYEAFIMMRPENTMPGSYKARQTEGVPSGAGTIAQYIELMQTHIQLKGYKLRHLRIIQDLIPFNAAQRSKFDLGVASQLCLLAINRPRGGSRNFVISEYEDDDSYDVQKINLF